MAESVTSESRLSIEGIEMVRSIVRRVLLAGAGSSMPSLPPLFEASVDSSSENEETEEDVIFITFADRFVQLDRINRYIMIVLETE